MPTISKRETATILAALQHYQETGLADNPELRSEAVHEIATDAGQLLASMCGEEVDALCERLNFDDSEALQTEAVGLLAECAGYLASARTDLKRTIAGDVFALQRMEWAEGAKEFAAKANALLEKIDDSR